MLVLVLQLTYADLAMSVVLHYLTWKEERAFLGLHNLDGRFTILVGVLPHKLGNSNDDIKLCHFAVLFLEIITCFTLDFIL